MKKDPYTIVEIDMRNDFSDDPRAALPVPGTLGLVGKIAVLEESAKNVLEVMDNHSESDPTSQEEFRKFPPHCIIGSWGHKRISGLNRSTLQLFKNTYDAWMGMHNSTYPSNIDTAMELLENSNTIVVVGVVTGICVKAFIEGAMERGMAEKTIIIRDCTANLDASGVPSTRTLFKYWSEKGIRIISFEEFIKERTPPFLEE